MTPPNPTPDEAHEAQNQAIRKPLKRFAIMLLAIGLILGGILSIGVVSFMKRLGLTDDTPGINKIREQLNN